MSHSLDFAVRTGLNDHLKTLNTDAQDCLKGYVLRVVVHKVGLFMYIVHSKVVVVMMAVVEVIIIVLVDDESGRNIQCMYIHMAT